jgi:dipeptidyl aminopeptidase/acylaminoacyl peptidase
MHAHKVSTATLNICGALGGALDRCTPSEEARQFHSALVENGVESILVTYPEEGHGVRKLPASVDYAARLASWIVEHTGNPAAANAT